MKVEVPGVGAREVLRVAAGQTGVAGSDELVVEEPLEIRLDEEPIAVTMRTPGDDRALVVGFLFAEGIIARLEDLGQVSVCGRPGEEGYGNVIEVKPSPGVKLDPEAKAIRRGTVISAACGVCGRATVEDLLARCRPIPDGPAVSREIAAAAPERLRENQPNFARTGGIHAAAALAADGTVLACAEDIGRHNAVDKVVGALLYRNELAKAVILAVSGRTSFEIVQKALAAGIPIVAGVSAVSTLAADLATKANLTVAGFVRAGSFTVYAHPERITGF